MRKLTITNVLLLLLLAVGFIGALKVSYENFTGSPCPHIVMIPICYVVLVAYGLMLAAMIFSPIKLKHYLFCAGWGTAFIVALAGSVSELMAGGGVCPTSGGGIRGGSAIGSIPLCYVSLAMLVFILIFFLMGPYKRACDIHNANAS